MLFEATTSVLVGEIIGRDAHKMGRWRAGKLQRPDIAMALHQPLDGAVHAIHQPAFGIQPNWVGGVGGLHQLHMLGYSAWRGFIAGLGKPVALIEFSNRCQWHPARLQLLGSGQRDELAYIPGLQALRAGAQMVLRAYVHLPIVPADAHACVHVAGAISSSAHRPAPGTWAG